MDRPKWFVVFRDLILLIGGVTGIAYQEISNDVNLTFLGIYVAATGIPAVAHVFSLARLVTTVPPQPAQVSSSSQPESPVS